jgi:hypothetical protein
MIQPSLTRRILYAIFSDRALKDTATFNEPLTRPSIYKTEMISASSFWILAPDSCFS